MAIFSAPINAVAVSAIQDLFSLKVGTTYPILIHEIRLGQKTLTATEGKEIEFHRLTATVTQGTGGTAPTPVLHSPGGAASTVTARINDVTTQCTSSGTDTKIQSDVWQFLNGYFYLPAPEDRLFFAPSTAFSLKLPTAPSASMTVSGVIVWEELGV
jgi:hypothetical protein